MILRPLDATARDAALLTGFRCSTGTSFEDEVEQWICTTSVAWASDVPRARFQRRTLALATEGPATTALVAWQDITRVDLDGIWLEVLAVAIDFQHGGNGHVLYGLTVDYLRAVEREGDHLAGLVHVDNERSKRLLSAHGWSSADAWDDHELWIGSL